MNSSLLNHEEEVSIQKDQGFHMEPVSSKAKRFVRPCKVTGCKNSVNSRGLCCSCTSLLKVRLKNGEINKDQYNSLLDPKRQGRKRSAQFDEWMKQTLLEKQFNNQVQI